MQIVDNRPAPPRDAVWTSFATFFVLGVGVVLVPSVIRQVQGAFGFGDATMGVLYLAFTVSWILGTAVMTALVPHVRRPRLIAAGPALVAAGILAMALGGSAGQFILGFLVMALGLGIIEPGCNALIMDLFRGREAGALNRMHMWGSVGGMTGPLAIGWIIAAGVDWQVAMSAIGFAIIPVALAMATRHLPAAGGTRVRSRASRRMPALPLPLLLFAIGIACYVAMEFGVTNWTVRQMTTASLEVATLALSLYWGGMALGRLLSSFVADRMGAVAFAAASSTVSGIAVIASLLAPTPAVAVACIAVAGFAAGPVYPMIMAIGGARYPDRTSVVASVLATAGIAGSLVYPPLMGVVSETVGLGVAMAGAGLIGITAAGAVVLGARLADVRQRARVPG